jgi:hypothetical protein
LPDDIDKINFQTFKERHKTIFLESEMPEAYKLATGKEPKNNIFHRFLYKRNKSLIQKKSNNTAHINPHISKLHTLYLIVGSIAAIIAIYEFIIRHFLSH